MTRPVPTRAEAQRVAYRFREVAKHDPDYAVAVSVLEAALEAKAEPTEAMRAEVAAANPGAEPRRKP